MPNYFLSVFDSLISNACVVSCAVMVALLLDLIFGEPPHRVHPVVIMGHYLAAVGRHVSRSIVAVSRPGLEFCLGAMGWFVGATLVLTLALVTSWAIKALHPLIQAALLGALLKPLFSWRMLRDEVRSVEVALSESLSAGQQRVGRLVSRDVTALSETQVREAAISTLAENLNDSVVAPLFWFVLAGIPGAALYRYANTADAMWGYRGERSGRDWSWAGKWAARADDVLSWLPARLTALLIVLPSLGRGWATLAVNARLTPSPNSGWPMGAMALSLGIRLGKQGVYVLNSKGRLPLKADTAKALQRCSQVVGMLALAATTVLAAGLT